MENNGTNTFFFSPIPLGDLEILIQNSVRKAINEQAIAPSQDLPDILGIDEAMKLTGYARQTIYGLVNSNKIPYIKRDGYRKLHFSRNALLDWISNKK